jgi:hypothetical protein
LIWIKMRTQFRYVAGMAPMPLIAGMMLQCGECDGQLKFGRLLDRQPPSSRLHRSGYGCA